MTARLEQLPETRRLILRFIKEEGRATAKEIAQTLGISPEGARQQLTQLQKSGWLERRSSTDAPRTGRPSTSYGLTVAGENLFPKRYDELVVAMVHALAERFGPDAPDEVWAAIAEARTRGWTHLANQPDLKRRVEATRDLYVRKDPYTRVERHPEGYDLIELNCPFINVAIDYPALCSTSVNMLTRILGHRVVREERFQKGDGRCVFRVYAGQASDTSSFEYEPPQTGRARLRK